MNDEKQQHSSRHEELLKQQALEQGEVREVLVFFQKYAKPAAIAVAVVCALVLADRFFKANRLRKAAKADAALAQAREAADYRAILDNYGSTPSAPLALMGLAMEKFNAGRIEEAEALYAKFLKRHGQHELAVQAELNAITCKEAKGHLGDAHLLYGDFAERHAESHLAPVARLNQARCLESLDQLPEAKQIYEEVITFYPGSAWSQLAEAQLRLVQNRLR